MAYEKNDFMKKINDLIDIMARLREPEKGCAWDLDQNFETIAPYTIEEAYEVVEAIQQKDMSTLKDELGDLLFQVVFHARLAEEENSFNFDDVVTAICDKLKRRHPHVFAGKVVAKDELAVQWEEAKRRERSADLSCGILADVSVGQPAMNQAFKLQKKAASIGFDWPNIEPVIVKLDEEINELKDEIHIENNKQRIEEELGDVMFSCINLARHLNISPEWSLRKTNERFSQRFSYIEETLKEEAVDINNCSLERLDELWNEAKKKR